MRLQRVRTRVSFSSLGWEPNSCSNFVVNNKIDYVRIVKWTAEGMVKGWKFRRVFHDVTHTLVAEGYVCIPAKSTGFP